MITNKLFETQKTLDDRIVEEKGLQGVDLIDKKILALQVELGELANEWRGFKFWSENKESNTVSYKCSECGFVSEENIDCPLFAEHIEFYMIETNPLLEEYVDCLHFILSIGNEFNCDDMEPYLIKINDPIEMFSSVYFNITKIAIKNDNPNYKRFYFAELLSRFFGLGKSLGFNWAEIEQAYYDKNKINHERQENGY